MSKLRIKILIIISLFTAGPAQAEQRAQGTKTVARDFVLIVGGINKDPEQKQAKDKAVMQLRKILVNDLGYNPEAIMVLADKESFVDNPTGASTAAKLQKTLADLAEKVTPADRFIFYYTGQANITTDKLRINLPGADVTDDKLAIWLNKITAAGQLIVLDCPSAGRAVKQLAAKDRVIICAARSDQPYSPRFSEFFLPALIDPIADNNKDGRVSLLEAFQQAAFQIDQLYRQANLMATEMPLLEDNGDGIPSQQPWRYVQDNNDGREAARFFLTPIAGNND